MNKIELIDGYWVDIRENKWNSKTYCKEEAIKMSLSLGNCSYCIDCRYCYGCTRCNDCFLVSHGWYCNKCNWCNFCEDCINCDYCESCHGCNGLKFEKELYSKKFILNELKGKVEEDELSDENCKEISKLLIQDWKFIGKYSNVLIFDNYINNDKRKVLINN